MLSIKNLLQTQKEKFEWNEIYKKADLTDG